MSPTTKGVFSAGGGALVECAEAGVLVGGGYAVESNVLRACPGICMESLSDG